MSNPFSISRFANKDNFCERPELEAKIQSIINSKGRLAVIGDRRLGKSSLVKEVARRSKIPHAYTDFMGVKTETDVANRLMVLLREPALSKLLRLVSPNILWDSNTGSIQGNLFGARSRQTLPIDETLASLVKATRQGRMTLIMDEFQDLADLNPELAVYMMGSFRREIQEMDASVIYIGSIRHKMLKIFTDIESPFYKSSEMLFVPEIPEKDFFGFVKPRFRKGNLVVDAETFSFLYGLAKGVTGDIISLCNTIYDKYAAQPRHSHDTVALTVQHIKESAEALIWANESTYQFYVKILTSKQIDCLLAIIRHGGTQPYRTELLRSANTTPAAMKRSLEALLTKGVLFLSGEEYKFFDPFFAWWLQGKY